MPWCTGAYADDFSVLSKAAAETNQRPWSQFSDCVRSRAVYECLSYASDGSVRRARQTATAHGTAFGFKKVNGETFLLTNAHLADWPAVSDDEHPVAGVGTGCKRVSEQLHVVDNEKDAFEGDDLLLTRVVSDAQLDIAIVKTRGMVNLMPWKLGRSSALRERNVVEVRGYPLGAFKNTVEGRVTSALDHDDYRDWDHDDFVIDAQLSRGNSGSPVLAVSCATGEYELVGIYHADYSRGNSLNVVVHADQLRELMTTMKRSSARRNDAGALTAQIRRRLVDETVELGRVFLPFGPLIAQLEVRPDRALVFSLFGREFPTASWPVIIVEDVETGPEGGFGHPGRLWFGNARGLRAISPLELDETELLAVERSLDALRRLAVVAVNYRRTSARAFASREATQDLDRLTKDLRRLTATSRDLSVSLLEMADKHDLQPHDAPVSQAGSPSAPPVELGREVEAPRTTAPVGQTP